MICEEQFIVLKRNTCFPIHNPSWQQTRQCVFCWSSVSVDIWSIPVEVGPFKTMKKLRSSIRKCRKSIKENKPTKPSKLRKSSKQEDTSNYKHHEKKLQDLESSLKDLETQTTKTMKKIPYINPKHLITQAMGTPNIRYNGHKNFTFLRNSSEPFFMNVWPQGSCWHLQGALFERLITWIRNLDILLFLIEKYNLKFFV